MDYIKINTPENIEIKYRLASVGSRMAAYIIDFMIICCILLLITIALMSYYFNNFEISWLLDFDFEAIGIYIIATFIVYFGYFIISELTMKGQSIGKKVFKLRVIKENGKPINFTASIVRNLIRYFVDVFGIGIIAIFFSKNSKRIGDMAASTVVIAEETNPINSEALALTSLLSNNQNVIATEKYLLSYEEYTLLKEYFNRKDKWLDGGAYVKSILIKYYTEKFNFTSEISENTLLRLLEMNVK